MSPSPALASPPLSLHAENVQEHSSRRQGGKELHVNNGGMEKAGDPAVDIMTNTVA